MIALNAWLIGIFNRKQNVIQTYWIRQLTFWKSTPLVGTNCIITETRKFKRRTERGQSRRTPLRNGNSAEKSPKATTRSQIFGYKNRKLISLTHSAVRSNTTRLLDRLSQIGFLDIRRLRSRINAATHVLWRRDRYSPEGVGNQFASPAYIFREHWVNDKA